MKRLFKNLMLVAVAAMAFVACSQDNDSINILAKKTVLHFNAGFADDTRSSFVEKEDGATSYKSVWNGGEQLIISICDSEGKVVGSAYAYVSLDEGVESAESMHFSAEYGGTIPENGSITVYSGNWYSDYYSGKYFPNIDSEQRGATDYSVASNFHICKSNTVEFTDGLPATIDLTFSTAVAFGKITMSQFSDVADKIEEVKVTINDNTTYTVTPATLTKPVVWFAAEAVEAVTKLSIEAKVDGVTYVKTAENLTTSFETGLVRPINVSAMTEKPADYNVVLTKVTNIEGNTISFVGENSNDKLTLVFNPGLEAIVAGTYIGVDAEYGSGFSSDSALEFNYNGSTFNISAAYNESYDYYMDEKSSIVITDLGDNNFRIVSTTPCWISNVKKTVKFTFEGKLEADSNTGGGEDPEQPAGIVFTSSLLEASSGFGDFYINLYDGDGLQLRFNFYNCQDADKNFLPEGTYIVKTGGGGIYYDASATYTYAAKDGEKTAILEGAVVVSESNGAYKFEVDLVTSAFGAIKGTYEGAIEGLILPSEYVEPEPEQPTDVTELTIARHHSIYSAVGQEHEIGFYYDVANSKFVDIDFMANPITAGTYTLDSGLNGYYCKSHGDFITNITVVVTDNGGGNLTFDATFKAGDGNWYHFTYTAQIYS